MGLDIVVYNNLKKYPGKYIESRFGDVPIEIVKQGYNLKFRKNNYFPNAATDIEENMYYKGNEKFHFRVGAYSSYNNWRDQLAKLLGYKEIIYNNGCVAKLSAAASIWKNPKPGPFVDLIYFSDCEGIIGTEISNKLYNDFKLYYQEAKKIEHFQFFQIYENFYKAFKIASNNGCVVFT